MEEDNSDDEECPDLVPVSSKIKIPVTIITGFLGKQQVNSPFSAVMEVQLKLMLFHGGAELPLTVIHSKVSNTGWASVDKLPMPTSTLKSVHQTLQHYG